MNNTHLVIYAARGNINRTVLTKNGAVLPLGEATRAQLTLKSVDDTELYFHIDTDNISDPIKLVDSNTVVEMRLGLIDGLVPGSYTGWLTVITNDNPDGEAWIIESGSTDNVKYTYTINVLSWPAL